MQKILVLRGGALGDFIVTLPVLAALRGRWPTAKIELAGNATAAELGRSAGLLDAVHSQHEARWSALHAASPLEPTFAVWLAEFDLVLNYWSDPDGALREKFPRRAGQIFLSAPALPVKAPAAAHYCAPLEKLGITTGEFFFTLPVAKMPRLRHPSHSAPIAIHAGSGSPAKNWPLARWLELSAWLTSAHGADLLIVTGEAESPTTRAPFASLGRVIHQASLSELAEKLSSCRLFLGHDSGISHLAAACGTPGILLFGPTDPAMWAPPAPHVHVVRRGASLDAITLADVQAAIAAHGLPLR